MAELIAITLALRLLRIFGCQGSVAWSTDSQYALGIMLYGNSATSELDPVQVARAEARQAIKMWLLSGTHTPAHIGFPPNECADVLAMMGRTKFALSVELETILRTVPQLLPSGGHKCCFRNFVLL